MKNKIILFKITLSLLLLLSFTNSQSFNSSRSIFSDLKGCDVGDAVTVLIVESANATRESKISSSSSSNIGAEGLVKGNLTDFLPLFGASSKVSNSHSGSEGTEQKERLTGKITAFVVERTENGLLRIKGEKLVEVNGERNLMKIEGYVRPRDIMENNTVYSYNVADVKIIYRKAGIKNKLFKPGTFQRLTTWAIGIGLIALSIMGLD